MGADSMSMPTAAVDNSDQNISRSSLSKQGQNEAKENHKKMYFDISQSNPSVEYPYVFMSCPPITYFNSNISIF